MSLPNTLDAFDDCIDYFDTALADPTGIRVEFAEYGQAHHFTLRMHQARALHRAHLRRVYAEDDHRYGRSEFDRLMVRQPREDEAGHWWVYIERSNSRVVSVEPLSQPLESPE